MMAVVRICLSVCLSTTKYYFSGINVASGRHDGGGMSVTLSAISILYSSRTEEGAVAHTKIYTSICIYNVPKPQSKMIKTDFTAFAQ